MHWYGWIFFVGILSSLCGVVNAVSSSITTMKVNDMKPGQEIRVGESTFVHVGGLIYMGIDRPIFCPDPVLTYAGASKNFTYTGNHQEFTAYAGCQYRVELWGAQGSTYLTALGGYGSYVRGELTADSITSGKMSLYVYVGQQPNSCGATVAFNGGGETSMCSTPTSFGGKGGSGTDIRTTSGAWNAENSLRSRIIVAAGGGGAGYWNSGGSGCSPRAGTWTPNSPGAHAGGLSGYNGYNNHYPATSYTTTGGNQTQGGTSGYSGSEYNGSFGVGGKSETGGGGGWYGGGGARHCLPGASSGSSYISGHTGCVAVTSLSDTTPRSGCTTGTTNNACSLSPTGLSFTDTMMIDGAGYSWTNVKGSLQPMPNPSGGYYASGTGHTGHGAARITRLN